MRYINPRFWTSKLWTTCIYFLTKQRIWDTPKTSHSFWPFGKVLTKFLPTFHVIITGACRWTAGCHCWCRTRSYNCTSSWFVDFGTYHNPTVNNSPFSFSALFARRFYCFLRTDRLGKEVVARFCFLRKTYFQGRRCLRAFENQTSSLGFGVLYFWTLLPHLYRHQLPGIGLPNSQSHLKSLQREHLDGQIHFELNTYWMNLQCVK